jgi:hypothetical protein
MDPAGKWSAVSVASTTGDPYGRRVAFQVGSGASRRSEIWVMEHFLPAAPKKSGPHP